MSFILKKIMKEAGRLTRSNRLQEVTRAMQEALGRMVAPYAAPQAPRAANDERAASPADNEGTFTGASFTFAGSTHSYKLYLSPQVASRPAPATGLPLVLMLHGCTQNPDDFATGTGMNALACEQGFAVLYPEQAVKANAQRCWNWFKPEDQQRDSGEPAWLSALVRHVMALQREQYLIDPRQVFVAGLSAGGAMASVLGHTHPDLFAAVGVHSGLVCGTASNVVSALSVMKTGRGKAGAASSVPTIVFHGDADAVVHLGNGEAVIQSVISATPTTPPVDETGLSAQGQRYTRTRYPRAGKPDQAERWVLHGAGHAWSGGNAQGSYTDPKGPDASREMWRFFQAQTQAQA